MAYNKYVQEMLDGTAMLSEGLEGLDPDFKKAEPILVNEFNGWCDPWNPLYSDAVYAKKSRYGRVIAFPTFFQELIPSVGLATIDPAGGFAFSMYAGENLELFKPIFPGEKYKVFQRPTRIDDITELGRDLSAETKGWAENLPLFAITEVDADVLDKDGELVGRFQHLCDCLILPEVLTANGDALPFKYRRYSEEDWEYVNSIVDGEKIRGAEDLYWEDVRVGEDLVPVTLGPTNIFDNVAFLGIRHEENFTPLRRLREVKPKQVLPGRDPGTNNYRVDTMWHFDRKTATIGGAPGHFSFGNFARLQMVRLISNWMGDSGELRALKWRHTKVTQVGDCTIVRGKVVGKKIEKGECLVEIDAFVDNLCRGNISESGRAWVKLPSRTRPNPAEAESIAYEHFKPGDKIRVKNRTEHCFPDGYPLADAEGVVLAALYPYQLAFTDYDGYVSVRITKSSTPLGIGDTLVLRAEELEIL